MSGLGQALPLALAAAVYPPALIVLLLLMAGAQPRKLVGTYYVGAALVTVGVGVVGLAVLQGANLTTDDSHDTSAGVYFFIGLLLLALGVFAWRHKPPPPKQEKPETEGRITVWSRRATTSARWAFVLGIAMYLPSPLYLLAIKTIADSGDGTASQLFAVLICAFCVMLFVEIPLIALFVWADGIAVGMHRFHDWLGSHAWRIVAVLALAGAVFAIVKGITVIQG